VLAALLAVGPAALASSIRDEIGVDRTQSTAQNPRAGSFSNLLGASFDVGEEWVVSGTAVVTLEDATPGPVRAALRDTGGTVTSFSLGADWDLSDRYSVGTRVSVSPESTTRSTATLTVERDGRAVSATAPVDVSGSSRSVELLADYDSAGTSDLEWAFSGSVNLTRDSTGQQVSGLRFADGTLLTQQETRAACALPRSRCPQALLRALDGNSADLGSARFSLSGTATLSRDTDLTLGGDYYAYGSDPAQFGYFGVAASRRQPEGIGAAIAPLRFVVRPEVAHRFGALSLRLWAQAGRYASGVGQSTAALGAKAQMRFGPSFRAWIAAIGQNDVDAQGDSARSAIVSVGGAWRF
jgi:hypothetical protein